jgi:hypothetical protein
MYIKNISWLWQLFRPSKKQKAATCCFSKFVNSKKIGLSKNKQNGG